MVAGSLRRTETWRASLVAATHAVANPFADGYPPGWNRARRQDAGDILRVAITAISASATKAIDT
jgi:hypothetical protein